jgi:hypothetical protein
VSRFGSEMSVQLPDSTRGPGLFPSLAVQVPRLDPLAASAQRLPVDQKPLKSSTKLKLRLDSRIRLSSSMIMMDSLGIMIIESEACVIRRPGV